MALYLSAQPTTPALAQRQEAQLCYVLLTVAAQGSHIQRAVNWALVADASRSMRIPIISEEQFRELVRSGGAHEVLVDGVPVWQFSRPVPPEVEATAPSALTYVQQALGSVVEHLHASDQFTLVVCAEEAVLLAPPTSGAERAALRQHIDRLQHLRLGNDTDLLRGMQMAVQQLRQQTRGAAQVRRLVLLTDGFTQQPEACIHLAQELAGQGIAVSTLGLGGDFQEDVLTTMADAGGGRAVFLRQPDEIPQAVAHELAAARAVAAQNVTLTLALEPGVRLRRATSITPTLTPLEPLPTPSTLHLGDLEQQRPARVLLELVIPSATGPHVPLARLRASSDDTDTASIDLTARASATPAPLPAPVQNATARAAAVRLQRRALAAAAQGNRDEAIRLLYAAAARLHELGETGLAALARQEADALHTTGSTTRLGAKELTYRTRRLGKGTEQSAP
jgi:hypothetical protein